MAHLNPNYGSELHLLRMLGRHREFLNREVLKKTGADAIEWCDFPAGDPVVDSGRNVVWDREWHHLEFLPEDDPARRAWATAWPIHRPGHRWDAVGRLRYGGAWEWLLIEAKANVEELNSTCGARDKDSVELIQNTLSMTKAGLGVPTSSDWMVGYYQYCNRLAALWVMNEARTPARLLYVYFVGDVADAGRTCPSSQAEWSKALVAQDEHVGLPRGHVLEDRVRKMFVDCRAR